MPCYAVGVVDVFVRDGLYFCQVSCFVWANIFGLLFGGNFGKFRSEILKYFISNRR